MSKTRGLWQKRFFDIAILDINIAGSSIAPVAEIIDRRGLPFLVVSGYGSGGRPEAFRSRPALRKPVLLSKLGETINAMLATPQGNLRRRFNKPHRPPHHDVHAAHRGVSDCLERAR
jgi:hypothetical protein